MFSSVLLSLQFIDYVLALCTVELCLMAVPSKSAFGALSCEQYSVLNMRLLWNEGTFFLIYVNRTSPVRIGKKLFLCAQ